MYRFEHAPFHLERIRRIRLSSKKTVPLLLLLVNHIFLLPTCKGTRLYYLNTIIRWYCWEGKIHCSTIGQGARCIVGFKNDPNHGFNAARLHGSRMIGERAVVILLHSTQPPTPFHKWVASFTTPHGAALPLHCMPFKGFSPWHRQEHQPLQSTQPLQ